MAKGIKRKELKENAQGELMSAMQIAFNRVSDNCISDQYTGNELEALTEEMSFQMERVEKLFGFSPKSWTRGI